MQERERERSERRKKKNGKGGVAARAERVGFISSGTSMSSLGIPGFSSDNPMNLR